MGVKHIAAKVFKRAATWDLLPFGTVIVAAAGASRRMDGEDKIFADLAGLPVLGWSLKELQACPNVSEIIVVTRGDSIVTAADLCAELEITKATKILCGGEDRLDSVLIGVNESSKNAEYIAVHDGARPFLTQEIIVEAFRGAYKHTAAAPAVPVNDTVKLAENGFVTETPDRAKLYAVQTPQVFRADVLKAALYNARSKKLSVTDDCGAAEAIGVRPALTKGSQENIKITRPLDMTLARAIAEARYQK